jgi:hypothetical protein
MNCPRCLLHDGIPGVAFTPKAKHRLVPGQCSACDLHDRLAAEHSDAEEWLRCVARIKEAGKNRPYDCLIGISGGFDSSYLVIAAMMSGLRALLFHFDNGWNAKVAEDNMERLVKYSEFDLIREGCDRDELREANLALLRAGVSSADIPNDLIMTRLFMDVALRERIPYVLNGHNFRTEGSCPRAWTQMDAKYLCHVMGRVPGLPLPFLGYQFRTAYRVKTVRPHYWLNPNRDLMQNYLNQLYGYQNYGAQHGENLYTKFVGAWLLPRKFHIDKRILYVSAQLRSLGIPTKSQRATAAHRLKETPAFSRREFDLVADGLKIPRSELQGVMETPPSGAVFPSYATTLRRLRLLIFLGYLAHLFPYTFYRKYCT